MSRCNTVWLGYGIGNRISDHHKAGIHATGPAYSPHLVQTRNRGDLPYHHAAQSRSQKLTVMAVGRNNKNDVRTPQQLHHRHLPDIPLGPMLGTPTRQSKAKQPIYPYFFRIF